MQELKNVVRKEKKRSMEKSRLSLLRSRTFLLPALLISISYTIQVTSGTELCNYYVGFLFKDVGIRLEIAGLIIQVILLIEGEGGDPSPAGDYDSRIPADPAAPVSV